MAASRGIGMTVSANTPTTIAQGAGMCKVCERLEDAVEQLRLTWILTLPCTPDHRIAADELRDAKDELHEHVMAAHVAPGTAPYTIDLDTLTVGVN